MTESTHRVNIVLPPESRDLADRLAEHLGHGSRSQAIRFALECAARQLGVPIEAPKKKQSARKRS